MRHAMMVALLVLAAACMPPQTSPIVEEAVDAAVQIDDGDNVRAVEADAGSADEALSRRRALLEEFGLDRFGCDRDVNTVMCDAGDALVACERGGTTVLDCLFIDYATGEQENVRCNPIAGTCELGDGTIVPFNI